MRQLRSVSGFVGRCGNEGIFLLRGAFWPLWPILRREFVGRPLFMGYLLVLKSGKSLLCHGEQNRTNRDQRDVINWQAHLTQKGGKKGVCSMFCWHLLFLCIMSCFLDVFSLLVLIYSCVLCTLILFFCQVGLDVCIYGIMVLTCHGFPLFLCWPFGRFSEFTLGLLIFSSWIRKRIHYPASYLSIASANITLLWLVKNMIFIIWLLCWVVCLTLTSPSFLRLGIWTVSEFFFYSWCERIQG